MAHCRGYDQMRGLFGVVDVCPCFPKLHPRQSAVPAIIDDLANQLKSKRPKIGQISFVKTTLDATTVHSTY